MRCSRGWRDERWSRLPDAAALDRLIDNCRAAWCELDAAARRHLHDRVWSESVTYTNPRTQCRLPLPKSYRPPSSVAGPLD
jgi:hypothetical protein